MDSLPLSELMPLLPGPLRQAQPSPVGTNAVWRLDCEGGVTWLKQHRAGRGYVQERDALRRWGAALPSPQLRASKDARRLLLLSDCPGDPVKDLPQAHRAAGAWLKKLHTLPHTDLDPLPLPQALRQRAQRSLARDLGFKPVRELLRGLLAEPRRFATLRRVPAHRDFAPNNWHFGPQGLFVFDFEHSRPDTALMDLVKLAGGLWPRAPELRAAFFEGYGQHLDPEHEHDLLALRCAWALDTLAWGLGHRDPGFIALGERALAYLE